MDDRFTGGDGLERGSLQYYLHRSLMQNELRGGRGGYELSNAGRAESGPSFGGFQYDIGGNARGRALLVQVARSALDANGRRILDDRELPQIQAHLCKPFKQFDASDWAVYKQLKPQIDQALDSRQGRELVNADYVQRLDEKVAHVNQLIQAVPSPENRRFLAGSPVAQMILLDTENQYGARVNEGLHRLMGMTAADGTMPMPYRPAERIGVRGALGLEDLVRYKLETAYAQSPAGLRDSLRRLSNIVETIGVENIPLSDEDRRFFQSGLRDYIRQNGLDPSVLDRPEMKSLRDLAHAPALGERQSSPRRDSPPTQPRPASPTPQASGEIGFDAAMRRVLPPQAGVKPHVTSPFHAERGAVDHQGVDFNYVGGQNGVNLRHPTVHAPSSGTVIFVGGEYGTVKIRDAQGNVHEILHMQTQSVHKGDVVQAGDPIGTMGGRGPNGANQYAQHVHYQLRDPQNRIVDPVAFWNDPRHRELGARSSAPPAPAPAVDAMRDGKLAFGESGPAVVQLQTCLNEFGIRDAEGRALPLTGNFRERTQAAVREFQRLHGLPDTGVADKATLDALAKSPEIKRGDHGPDVLHVQQMLERAGINVPKTGTFTYLTEGAVKEFQATHGIEPTGVVSGQTLYELRRAEQQARKTVPVPEPSSQTDRVLPSPSVNGDVMSPLQPRESRSDHPLVTQARPLVEALDRDVGRIPDALSERVIAGVAAKAQAEGLDRIDTIVFSNDRSRLIAVQEDGEARRIAAVDIRRVVDTPAEASFAQLTAPNAISIEREPASRAARVV